MSTEQPNKVESTPIETPRTDARVLALDFVKALGIKFRTIVTQPTDFFQNLDLSEDPKNSAIFLGSIIVVNTGVNLLIAAGMGRWAALLNTLFYWIAFQMGAFLVSSVMMHYLARMVGGSGHFQTSLKAYAYAWAANVLFWLPFINVFTYLLSLYDTKVALERVEGVQAPRSTFVVFATAVVVSGTVILMYVAGIAMLIKKAGAGAGS